MWLSLETLAGVKKTAVLPVSFRCSGAEESDEVSQITAQADAGPTCPAPVHYDWGFISGSAGDMSACLCGVGGGLLCRWAELTETMQRNE